MRSLVVGDIHGGLKALIQVLKKVNPQTNDQFIFLGDYVDGWSEASEVISFLINFSKKHTCIFLKGNHDELCYGFLKKDDHNPLWLNSGGKATRDSYSALSEEKKAQHLQFFEGLRNYYVDAKNRLFVHAGFTNPHGPSYEYYPRMVYWERTLWETAVSLDKELVKDDPRYPKRLTLFSEIYIGHTPTTRLDSVAPLNFANVWNIDTGAAFKGPLTIIDVDTKEFWQSDLVYSLYPEEVGRN